MENEDFVNLMKPDNFRERISKLTDEELFTILEAARSVMMFPNEQEAVMDFLGISQSKLDKLAVKLLVTLGYNPKGYPINLTTNSSSATLNV